MADDAAHITPGPPPPPSDSAADPASGEVTPAAGAAPQAAEADAAAGADAAAVAVASQPAVAAAADDEAFHEVVDVIGRSQAPVAARAPVQPAAVLVGAAAGAREEHMVGAVAGVAPASHAVVSERGFPAGEDAPLWSFRAREQRSITLPAPVDDAQAELPFAPSAEPARPSPRPLPTFGPVGRARSTILVPLFAVASLGIYALVWHHRVNRELEEFDPKLHARPGQSTLAVTLPWLLGLLVTLAGAALTVATRLSIHIPFDTHLSSAQALALLAGLAAVPYLVLVLPFSLVAVVMTLERLRSVEEHVGTTTDRQVRPVAFSLLLAIPVVGGLVLVGVEQSRLNAIWNAVAPPGFFPN